MNISLSYMNAVSFFIFMCKKLNTTTIMLNVYDSRAIVNLSIVKCAFWLRNWIVVANKITK